MTFIVDRLAELRKHVDHLRGLRSRVVSAASLEGDLSLHNDVLFSLFMVSQTVIDVAGELSAHKGLRFEDYTEAIRNLAALGFSADLVESLSRLPGFRNVLVHEYAKLDLARVVEAMDDLDAIDTFLREVAGRENQ